MLKKIGVANLKEVANQTNYVTIQQEQSPRLVYSDPLPNYPYFQGRSGEIEKISNWLTSGTVRIIALHGEGGIGKSTLMAKVFVDSSDFKHKCWLDVSRGKPFPTAARQALKKFGIAREEVDSIREEDLLSWLLSQLQESKCLLAIDNVESLLTESGEWRFGDDYGKFINNFYL